MMAVSRWKAPTPLYPQDLVLNPSPEEIEISTPGSNPKPHDDQCLVKVSTPGHCRVQTVDHDRGLNVQLN